MRDVEKVWLTGCREGVACGMWVPSSWILVHGIPHRLYKVVDPESGLRIEVTPLLLRKRFERLPMGWDAMGMAMGMPMGWDAMRWGCQCDGDTNAMGMPMRWGYQCDGDADGMGIPMR